MQTVLAKIHNKNGAMEEVTICEPRTINGCTTYIVKTKDGVKCTAIYNPFIYQYFADDIYSIIKD